MKTNKRKLTRNSFKRKIIVFGVAVFMSVAMVATGFAAWIISTNAQADGQVSVNVAEISQGNLTVTLDDALYNEDGDYIGAPLRFGPRADDTSGYLKSSKDNTVNAGDAENLKFTVKGVVSGATNLGALTLTLDLSALKDAIEANHIAFDATDWTEVEKEGVEHTYIYEIELEPGDVYDMIENENYTGAPGEEQFKAVLNENKKSFSIEVSLKWGTHFGSMNPGDYYDQDGHFEGKTDSEILSTINTDLTALNGYLTGKEIKVTVTAEVN